MSPAFSDKLARGFFVPTADLLPGRSGEPLRLAPEAVQALREAGCAVNVADMPSAVLSQAPIASAVALLQEGIEPILQVTGRDRNRLAIQADLLAAHALGVRTLLCLTGDHTAFGDHRAARPVFDLSATEILKAVSGLNAGGALEGRPLDAPTDFAAGAAVNPSQLPLEPQLARAVAKQRAGARFFQTQPLFGPIAISRFLEAAAAIGLTTPVLVGVFLLESAKMARFMNERVPGITVPPEVVRGLEGAADPVAYGIELAKESVAFLREAHGAGAAMVGNAAGPAVGVPQFGPVRPPRPAGVHVMSLNRHMAVAAALS